MISVKEASLGVCSPCFAHSWPYNLAACDRQFGNSIGHECENFITLIRLSIDRSEAILGKSLGRLAKNRLCIWYISDLHIGTYWKSWTYISCSYGINTRIYLLTFRQMPMGSYPISSKGTPKTHAKKTSKNWNWP